MYVFSYTWKEYVYNRNFFKVKGSLLLLMEKNYTVMNFTRKVPPNLKTYPTTTFLYAQISIILNWRGVESVIWKYEAFHFSVNETANLGPLRLLVYLDMLM